MKSLAIELLKDLDAIENIKYTPHSGQQPFHASKARFRILAAGRRFGKTQAACFEAVQKAIVQPGATVWIVAPIFGQSMISWRMIRQFLPLALVNEYHLTEKYIELKTDPQFGSSLEIIRTTCAGKGLIFWSLTRRP